MNKASVICIMTVLAGSVYAAVTTSNLLINPDAEEGNTTGWKKLGNIRAVKSLYETTGRVEELSGEYFFAMGLGRHFGPSSISQRIDLSFLTADTLAGFTAKGYVQTQLWPPMGTSFDKGKLIVEFFDSNDNTLGQFILDPVEHPVLGSSAGGRDYGEFSLCDNIPAGASYAVLTLEGHVVQGVNIDVYYDDLSFVINLKAGLDRKVSVAGGLPSDSLEANLGDHITITITVDNPYEHELRTEDVLTKEFKYIPGTFRINNVKAKSETSANTVSASVLGGTNVITYDAQVVEVFAEQQQTTITTETNLYNPAGEKIATCASADITLHPYEGISCGIERCTHDPWYEIPVGTDVHWLLLIELRNTAGDQITAMKEITVHDLEVNEASIYVFDPPPSSGTVTSENKNNNSRANVTWKVGDLNKVDPLAQLWFEISANLNADDVQNNLDDYQELNAAGEYKLSSDAVVDFTDPETGLKLSAHTCPLIVTVVWE